jgi:exodeoxyribonuclease V alpha subunit
MEVPLKLEGKKSVEDIGNLERMDGKTVVPAVPGYLQSMLKKLCKENIPAKYNVNPIRDIQVLAPMKKGTAGVHELNLVLQDALNPYGEPVKFGAREFRVGDRIMVFKNNYDLETYNGDIGFVLGTVEIAAKKDDDDDDFDDEPDEAVQTSLYSKAEMDLMVAADKPEQKPAKMDRYLKVLIDDVEKCYPEKEAGNLQLAYCQTIHKSQGSEFPIVILCLVNQHYTMLERNLIYTGLTRARNMCLFLASKKALTMAVNNCKVKDRNSLLGSRIKRAIHDFKVASLVFKAPQPGIGEIECR